MLTTQGHLPASKTYALDAFLYCVVRGIGVKIIGYNQNSPIFQMFDFDVYYLFSKQISHPTEWNASKISRVKTLSRWFSPVTKQLLTSTTTLTASPKIIDRLNKRLTKAKEQYTSLSSCLAICVI